MPNRDIALEFILRDPSLLMIGDFLGPVGSAFKG